MIQVRLQPAGNTVSLIGKAITDIEKSIALRMEQNAHSAAEYFADKVKEAYGSSSGKRALSDKWPERAGGIPLFYTGALMNGVVALPDGKSKNKVGWRVTMKPGVGHPSGEFGGRGGTLQQVASYHETGFTATLPSGHRVFVAPRPVWLNTWQKEQGTVMSMLSGNIQTGGRYPTYMVKK